MKRTTRFTGAVLASLMAVQALPLGAAHAGMVPTETVARSVQAERAHLTAQLDRTAMRDALARHGVSAGEAEARINALSDTEVAALAARIDEDPAGQAVGLILTAGLIALLILVVADATDHTDVF